MNYYELLEIPQDADKATVKRAYFGKVKLHSPDKDPEGFKGIRLAYETLMDAKKRGEYDSYFSVTSDVQNEVLYARELMRENNYKKASDYLLKLLITHPDSVDIKLLLAEVHLRTGKSGKAGTICKDLIESYPNNAEIWLLQARVAEERGHNRKASDYYERAVKLDPMNSKIWIAYLDYLDDEKPYRHLEATLEALSHSPDMFQDEYYRYLHFVYEYSDELNKKETIQWLEFFTKYYVEDKNPDENVQQALMMTLPHLARHNHLFPIVEKLATAVKNNPNKESEEMFEQLVAIMAYHRLSKDSSIDEVLAQLTAKLMGGNIPSEVEDMEAHIIQNLSIVRKSLKVLRKKYPDYYELHKKFYDDALDPSKEDQLLRNIYENLEFENYEVVHDGGEPYIREMPKVGRNAPCPCGSGKKFKHCCG